MRNGFPHRKTAFQVGLVAVVLWRAVANTGLTAAEPARPAAPASVQPAPEKTAEVRLTAEQWKQLNASVDRGLQFLSTQQQSDGSFRSDELAQPAVTSFCVMAFLSRGHMPGRGPFGEQISRAIDYVLSTQQPSGLLFAETAGTEEWKLKGSYNHAIAGVMLGEVYGMTESHQKDTVRVGILRALEFTRQRQKEAKRWPDDRGGWRYLLPSMAIDSDLSLTAWHLMFYRSARNAEFDVPKENMDEAVAYVQRCFDAQRGSFAYGLRGRGRGFFSRSMAGAGVVSLSLAGNHRTDMAKSAGQFILKHPFDRFNQGGLAPEDRFYYGAFYCSQAAFQLGGEFWEKFYPVLLETMVDNQRNNGSWDREANQDEYLGYAYSTSLAILALTPPYQLLPIYQR